MWMKAIDAHVWNERDCRSIKRWQCPRRANSLSLFSTHSCSVQRGEGREGKGVGRIWCWWIVLAVLSVLYRLIGSVWVYAKWHFLCLWDGGVQLWSYEMMCVCCILCLTIYIQMEWRKLTPSTFNQNKQLTDWKHAVTIKHWLCNKRKKRTRTTIGGGLDCLQINNYHLWREEEEEEKHRHNMLHTPMLKTPSRHMTINTEKDVNKDV